MVVTDISDKVLKALGFFDVSFTLRDGGYAFVCSYWHTFADRFDIPDPGRDGFTLTQLPNPSVLDLVKTLRILPSDCVSSGYTPGLPARSLYDISRLSAMSFRVASVLRYGPAHSYFARLMYATTSFTEQTCTESIAALHLMLESFCGDHVALVRSDAVEHDLVPSGFVVIRVHDMVPMHHAFLAILGAVYAGCHVTILGDGPTMLMVESFLRLCLACGLPHDLVTMVPCQTSVLDYFLEAYGAQFNMVKNAGPQSPVPRRPFDICRPWLTSSA